MVIQFRCWRMCLHTVALMHISWGALSVCFAKDSHLGSTLTTLEMCSSRSFCTALIRPLCRLSHFHHAFLHTEITWLKRVWRQRPSACVRAVNWFMFPFTSACGLLAYDSSSTVPLSPTGLPFLNDLRPCGGFSKGWVIFGYRKLVLWYGSLNLALRF